MAFQEALCRIRVRQPTSHEEQASSVFHKEEPISARHAAHGYEQKKPLISCGDMSRVPGEIRREWASLMIDEIVNRGKLEGDNCGVRDLDFVLDVNGSVENRADNVPSSSPSTRSYPARYQIPNEIISRLDSNQDKVRRAELFALGGLLYQVFSGFEMLSHLGSDVEEEYIRSCFVKGEFPGDVWGLKCAVKILACWCPGFAEDLLVAHSENKSVLSKFASYFASYAKKHPILFGIQVAGGIMSLASIAAVPVLGVVGFGAAGPIAGSTAAAWQSGIGLVKAGSIYAWCQSAAMGGAAMGHILATGVAGVSGAVGATTVAGALDVIAISESELKEIFMKAWKREGGAAMGGSLATGQAGVSVTVGAIVEGTLDDIAIPAPELKEKFLKAWERDIGEAQ